MRPIRVAEDILPLSELEGHVSEVVEGLRARGRPTVITQGGKAAAVLISPEEFDRLTYEAHVVAAIEQGLADADAGRVVDDEELDAVLAARIGDLAG
jgi:prevent-host-death family protein